MGQQHGFVRSFFPLIVSVLLGVALIWWWALSTAHAADEPLAFKGLMMGAGVKEVKKRYPRADCSGRTICLVSNAPSDRPVDTIASAPISMMLIGLHENRVDLISMSIPASGMAAVIDAVTDRYGPVTSDSGTRRADREVQWRLSAGMISVIRSSEIRDHATVLYRTHDGIARRAEHQKIEAAKSRRDL